MTVRLPVLLLSLVLSATISGCSSSDTASSGGQAVTFITLHQGQYLENGDFTSKSTRVLQNQQDYETALAGYSSESPKTVDFSTRQVLLLDMGQKNSGGYSLAVQYAMTANDAAVVNVSLYQPGENCLVTQAMTNPWLFVSLETTATVLVNESLQTESCN